MTVYTLAEELLKRKLIREIKFTTTTERNFDNNWTLNYVFDRFTLWGEHGGGPISQFIADYLGLDWYRHKITDLHSCVDFVIEYP